MADLGLPDAVDAAEALLDAVRVPRQVVVDHQVGPLQVQSLPGGVGGDEHTHAGVRGELVLNGTAVFPGHTSVDRHDGVRIAEQCSDPVDEVSKRVPVLGEDDQLAQSPARERDGIALQDLPQLLPLAVAVLVPHGESNVDQLVELDELDELDSEFFARPRRFREVDDLVLELLVLGAGDLVIIEEV